MERLQLTVFLSEVVGGWGGNKIKVKGGGGGGNASFNNVDFQRGKDGSLPPRPPPNIDHYRQFTTYMYPSLAHKLYRYILYIYSTVCACG